MYRQPVVGLTVVRLPATIANIELEAEWAAQRQLLRRIELPNEFHLVLTKLASRPQLRQVAGHTSDAIQPTLRLAVVAHHPGDAMDHRRICFRRRALKLTGAVLGIRFNELCGNLNYGDRILETKLSIRII